MDESQKKQAWISSLRLLAASPKTRGELAKKLTEKGYPEEIVRQTLDQLESQGLLSDRAYAVNLLSRFVHAQPSGRRRIAFEMKKRGVPAKIREDVLSQVTPEQEADRAREIGLARWERFKNLDEPKRKKRVYDFLIRRGFDFQLVRDVVEEFASGNSNA